MKIQSTFIAYIIIILGLSVLAAGSILVIKNTYFIHKHKTISVLFIGNSLTFVNDLPKTLSDIAASLGDTVDYDSSTVGGYTLMQHTQTPNTVNKILSRNWDYVVLQEQSQFPGLSDEKVATQTLPFALELNDLIKKNPNSKSVFFETWAHQNGDPDLCLNNSTLCSYTAMQNQVFKSYSKISEETGGLLAPVGEAWRKTISTHPEIKLFQIDGEHPTPEGTYLAACVFYVKLFNRDVGKATPLLIDSAEAKILKTVARQTVLGQ